MAQALKADEWTWHDDLDYGDGGFAVSTGGADAARPWHGVGLVVNRSRGRGCLFYLHTDQPQAPGAASAVEMVNGQGEWIIRCVAYGGKGSLQAVDRDEAADLMDAVAKAAQGPEALPAIESVVGAWAKGNLDLRNVMLAEFGDDLVGFEEVDMEKLEMEADALMDVAWTQDAVPEPVDADEHWLTDGREAATVELSDGTAMRIGRDCWGQERFHPRGMRRMLDQGMTP